MTTDSAPTVSDAREFARLADITRRLWHEFGYHVHVETNARRVTLAPDLRPGFCNACGVRFAEHPTNWCAPRPTRASPKGCANQ